MKPLDVLAAMVVVAVWGVNFAAVKVAVAEIPPLTLTALRFALVAAMLAPLFRPRIEMLPGIALLSFSLGVCHFGLMFLGISGLDAATAAIATQLSVPFSILLAAAFFGERLGWRAGFGMVLAFGGVALLAGEPTLPRPLPLLMVVAAALAWAASNIVIKRIGAVSPFVLNGWMALLAAPQLLILSLAVEDGQTGAIADAGWAGWGGLAFIVLGASLTAYSLWYHLLAKYPVSQVVPYTLLVPVAGVAAGIALLGEPLTWHKLVGGGLTLLGVAIIQKRRA